METMDTAGSPEFVMTWKKRAMQSGAPICRLAARARRPNETGFSSWPACKASDAEKGIRSEAGAVKEAERTNGPDLPTVAALTPWPAPGATGHGEYNDPEKALKRVMDSQTGEKRSINLQEVAALAPWPCPTALSFAESHQPGNNRSMSKTMELLTPWVAPIATDHKATSGGRGREKNPGLRVQVLGATSPSSTAETEKPVAYRLNPRFSLWLQGYPEAWACCAALGIALCRKSRRRSSKRS